MTKPSRARPAALEAVEQIEVEGPFASPWHALGHPDADLMVVKAGLVLRLDKAIKDAGITRAAAAGRIGIAGPNLTRVLSGHFQSVTLDALWRYLRAMGIDVQVTAAPTAGRAMSTAAVAKEAVAAVPRRASRKRASAERA